MALKFDMKKHTRTKKRNEQLYKHLTSLREIEDSLTPESIRNLVIVVFGIFIISLIFTIWSGVPFFTLLKYLLLFYSVMFTLIIVTLVVKMSWAKYKIGKLNQEIEDNK